MGFAEGPQPALDRRRVGQHPAVQGGVVDLEAALEEQLLDVTVAERIARIPEDGLTVRLRNPCCRQIDRDWTSETQGATVEAIDRGLDEQRGTACGRTQAEKQVSPRASGLSGAELRLPRFASGPLCCAALYCAVARTPAHPGVLPLRLGLRRAAE